MRAAARAVALPQLVDGGTFGIGRGGCERVQFLQSYNKSWTLTAMSPSASVASHRTASRYYNEWTVTGPATAIYALHYSGTSGFRAAFLAGALVGVAYLGCVFGADAVLRRYARPAGRHRRRERLKPTSPSHTPRALIVGRAGFIRLQPAKQYFYGRSPPRLAGLSALTLARQCSLFPLLVTIRLQGNQLLAVARANSRGQGRGRS